MYHRLEEMEAIISLLLEVADGLTLIRLAANLLKEEENSQNAKDAEYLLRIFLDKFTPEEFKQRAKELDFEVKLLKIQNLEKGE